MALTPLERAWELYREARRHKLQESYHRRLARARMEDLREFCRVHDIDLDEIKQEDRANGRVHADPIPH